MKSYNFRTLMIFILLIVITFSCVASFASCANDSISSVTNPTDEKSSDSADGDTVQESTEDPYDPKLPPEDFNGTDFRILNINQDSMWWTIIDLDIEADLIDAPSTAVTDYVVNDAIYKRNRTVEAKYNFVIKETKEPSNKVFTMIRNSVKAGTDDFDLVAPTVQNAAALAAENCLVDLTKVPNLNFEKIWWNDSANRYFSIGNRLFFACSDFTLADKDNVGMTMYNKKLSEKLGIDSAETLYRLVDEGKWTFDKFTELCKTANADLDGDGLIKGDGDRYGLVCCSWLYNTMLAGFGEPVIKKDSDDMPYIACKTERFASAYKDMVEFMLQRDVVCREFIDVPGKTEDIFVDDKALFCIQVLAAVRHYKNMGSDFALLPMPKYNETQESYYSAGFWSSILAIPTTNPDIEKTGFILEALSAESTRTVIPAYYEISIGTKYLRDDDSIRMLDIILQNRIYDINEMIYNWAGFNSALSSAAVSGNVNVTSLIERFESKIEAAMQKTVTAYDEIE